MTVQEFYLLYDARKPADKSGLTDRDYEELYALLKDEAA